MRRGAVILICTLFGGCTSSGYTPSPVYQKIREDRLPADNDADYSLPYSTYTPETPVPPKPPPPEDNDNAYTAPSWYAPFKKIKPPEDNDADYRMPSGVPVMPDNGNGLPRDNDAETIYIYPLYMD